MTKNIHVRTAAVLFVFLTAGVCRAQDRFTGPQPCRLLIEVTYEDGREKVAFANVELMDALGSSSAMDRQDTNKDGRVEFNTMTGKHRVRITGADFATYESDFEIERGEGFHMEYIRVRRSATGTAPIAGVTNAARLKVPEKAKDEVAKGREASQKHNWEEARRRFQAAIEVAPDYDLAYNGLGIAAMQMKDTEAARAAFAKAISLNENFAEAQRNLARIRLADKEYGPAAELLTKSLATDPGNTWALLNAAYAELQLSKFGDAVLHAQRVHALRHEGFANAHVIAGYALEALGRKSEAVAELRLYLKEDPKGPNVKRAKEMIDRLSATN